MMFLRTFLLLLLVGCDISVPTTELQWRAAEHMCRNNEGPRRVQVYKKSTYAEVEIFVECNNGMWGKAIVKDQPEKTNG